MICHCMCTIVNVLSMPLVLFGAQIKNTISERRKCVIWFGFHNVAVLNDYQMWMTTPQLVDKSSVKCKFHTSNKFNNTSELDNCKHFTRFEATTKWYNNDTSTYDKCVQSSCENSSHASTHKCQTLCNYAISLHCLQSSTMAIKHTLLLNNGCHWLVLNTFVDHNVLPHWTQFTSLIMAKCKNHSNENRSVSRWMVG